MRDPKIRGRANAYQRISRDLAPVVVLAIALYVVGARAEEPAKPVFSFGGFGTLGLTHSSENRADYSSAGLKPKGAGFSGAWSADVDSRIGAQITANFTPQLSAVLQVISELNYDNTYRPLVEWANIKYQFTPEFSARIGRTVLPVFLVSDYRKVGYANPWVRPPVEVYSLVPISTSDGVDASYRVKAGRFTHTLQGTYGRSEPRLAAGGTAVAKGAWGLAYSAEFGATLVHVSYHKTALTLASYKPLFDAFRQFGAEGIAIADRYDPSRKPFEFIGVGATYDPGKWFVTGEWGYTDSHAVLGSRSGWYASGGYRLGKFTPYVTYARAKAESNRSDPGLTLGILPPFLVPTAAGLNASLNANLGSIPVQQTISVGTRWDFAKSAALKFQFDHTRIGAGSPGTLINIQPGFQTGGKVNVFSTTLDFVF